MLPRISIISRPAVLAASLAAVLAVASTPATADGSREVALRLDAAATFHMYNADEGAKATNSDFVVPVFVLPSDAGPARNVKVVVDASGLKGVARAEKGGYGNCTGQGPVFTCVYGDLQNGDGETNAPFTLYGVDGVEPGDSGTVTYTATADNASPVTGTTRMTVGGPTLHSPVAQKPVKGVEPGKSVPLTPRFANHSRFATGRGVALQLTVHSGRLSAPHPRNCFLNAESTSAWCEFATRAAPGTAYRTGVPIGWTADPGTLAGTVVYSWSSDLSRPDGITVHGKGAPLTLTRTADHGLTSGTGNVSFETTVQDDYEAVPETVRGRVGDTVTVRLGLRDHGPGRPEVGGDPDAWGGFEVVPPEGTTVTSIPYTVDGDLIQWACQRPQTPGGAFVCDIGKNEYGATAIDFHIRIDRQVPGAQGTIRTYNPFDRTPGNDTAVIPLQASPAPFYRHSMVRAMGAGAVAVLAVLMILHRRRRRAR
ncbi:hypothetical protein [Streptomyces sp. NRRL B-24720]|uniref:hypothetical protein n=1 Tax=Streptomyces sp. NRRL B-24720 TaxID=1476876 RepID=UPI0004CADB23|nr:hypothetical protein [Streptomyces sp. NRRL B-24720]